MSAGLHVVAGDGGLRARLAHQARILRVIAAAEYKLKYADSALGYIWSLAKPLALFGVLYVVFARFFKVAHGFGHYPIYLLVGIVLWTYFIDATTLSMTSLVARATLLRKLAFPHLVIPVSVTVTAGLTFLVNCVAIAILVAVNGVLPRLQWLIILPLLAELYAFTLAVSLILSVAYVRLRDVRQVWELLAQLLFYASPIIYPVGFLPPWAKPIAFVSPFVQVMQDVRALILPGPQAVTAATVYGTDLGWLAPLGFLALLLGFALWLFRRESPFVAERV